MSDAAVTLEFLSRQLRRVIDDIASLKDDMGVLTAMVVRHDQEFSRLNAKLDDMFNQMRAMVRQHQRFSERLRVVEEERR
jgi:septation ring formation regulator EzrA